MNLSRGSLCRSVTFPPFLQSREWVTVKPTPQPSQWCSRSGDSIPYGIHTASRHSWAPISVPLAVIGAMVIHLPVFCPRLRRRHSNSVSFLSPCRRPLWPPSPAFGVSQQIRSLSSCACSPGWNSVRTCRSATRCPVTTHENIQLRCTVCVGSGIAIPTYLTSNTMVFRTGMDSNFPIKSTRMKSSRSALSIVWKSSPRPLVVHCMKAHSCWRDLCRPSATCSRVRIFYAHISLWLVITQVSTQVVAACDNCKATPLEEAFIELEVFLGDDQDALGRHREIPLGGSAHHDGVEVCLDVLEWPSWSCVVGIPQVGHLWMWLPEI